MRDDCPFCHHEQANVYREAQQKITGGTGTIMRCDECGLLYPRPRFDGPESTAYLARLNAGQNKEKFLDPLRPVSKRDYLVRALRRYAPLKGCALDIGTCEGRNCFIFKSLGFAAYGIEPQDRAACIAREYGLWVYTGAFPDAIPPEITARRYDLVSAIESMYYFVDLRKSLATLLELLVPGGLLLVQSHQGGSRYYRGKSYFSRYGDYVQAIPTVGSLCHCLRKSGFEIVTVKGLVSYDLLPVDLSFMRNDLARRIILRLYNEIFLDRTLLDIGQADRLIVLARKRRVT